MGLDVSLYWYQDYDQYLAKSNFLHEGGEAKWAEGMNGKLYDDATQAELAGSVCI
jgi:hypothetical protein